MAERNLGQKIKSHWPLIVLATAVIVLLAISAYRASVAGWPLDAWESFAELALLSIGLVSLRLLHRQMSAQTAQVKKDLQWKKINSFFEFFHTVPADGVNDRLHKIAENLGLLDAFSSKPRPISDDELVALLAPANDVAVKTYLDAWESFAGAVRCGLVDDDFAYRMECGRVLRTFTIFQPYIEYSQKHQNSRAYLELELLAQKWSQKREDDVKRERAGNGVVPDTLSH